MSQDQMHRSEWIGYTERRTMRRFEGLDGYDNDDEERERPLPEIAKLPAIASSLLIEEGEERPTFYGWVEELRLMLIGSRDEGSNLSYLRGLEDTVLKEIFSYIASQWASHVTLTIPAEYIASYHRILTVVPDFHHEQSYRDLVVHEREDLPLVSKSPNAYVSFASCGMIIFPPPLSINRDVNMMPFIFGDINSLPAPLQFYYDCIEKCPYDRKQEGGKVGYLTVHEEYVEEGKSQRREGLHIETPGLLVSNDDLELNPSIATHVTISPNAAFSPGREHSWGGGHFYAPDRYEGGIYMASTLSGSSVVYNALVDKEVKGITDRHGGCEHLRCFIGPGTELKANELIWMTDCTPHEAIPQNTSGYRQFFRVVTSKISHWFADHSTSNPKVSLPPDVVVVKGNKFQNEGI